MSRALDTAKSQQSNSGPTPPFVAGKNFQINGGFDIWQRGTTLNNVTHSTYTADQWVVVTDSVGTVNITQQNIAAQGLNSVYAMRVEKSAGASNRVVMVSVPEGALSCVGKTITVSGYLRKGSGLTSNVGIDLGTRAYRYGPLYDAATTLSVNNASLNTSTFTRFSLSFNVTTATSTNNANLLEFEVFFTQAGGANVYLEIAAIQIEVGSAATPFSHAGGTLQGELAACQRYYWRFIDGVSQWVNMAAMFNAGQLEFAFRYVVPMRAAPTLIASTGTSEWNFSRNGASDPFNSLTLYQATTQSCLIYNNSEISGTAGHAGNVYSNQATSSAALSAEL